MAKNIELGAMPPFYQESVRPVEKVYLKDLKGTGEAFNAFSAENGTKFSFPVLEKMELRRQRVQAKLAPGQTPTWAYSVGCEREYNGVKRMDWFPLSILNMQDADRNYVNPTWANLGDNQAKVEALAKIGSITIDGSKEIQVPVFQGGRPQYVPTLNPLNGEQVITEDGTAKTHVLTRSRKAFVVSPYVAA